MQYNISETLDKISINKDVSIDGDFAVCANGAQYRKDVRGFLPELMEKIYDERKQYKSKMLAAKRANEESPSLSLQKDISRYNNFQMARKIQLNSAYGAIGNEYFRYYKLANAEAITLSGQVSIRWIENEINIYLNKLLQTRVISLIM